MLEWNAWGDSKFHVTRIVKAESGWPFVRDDLLISFQHRDFYGSRNPLIHLLLYTYYTPSVFLDIFLHVKDVAWNKTNMIFFSIEFKI